MKKIKLVIIAFLILTSSTCFGQLLSLDQLIYLQKKDLDFINSYLLSKGWEFKDSSNDEDSYSRTSWALGNTKQVNAWFSLFSHFGYENRLSYQLESKKQYFIVKARVQKLGMKLLGSKVDDGYIEMHYVGKNYAVILRSVSKEYSFGTSYIVLIYNKLDYNKKMINSDTLVEN